VKIKSKSYICLSFLLCIATHAHAQTGYESPIVFDQFFQNYNLLNPASEDSTGKGHVRIGNRSLIGLFSGVNRLYVDGDVKIKHRSFSQYSKLGLLVIAYNDGAFISRTKGYLRYSWTTQISSRSSISAGLAIGIVKYTLLGSQAGGGGSSTAFDGNIGLWYIRSKLKIGISYQQFTRSELTPVNQTFQLIPYLNFNIIYASYISPYVLLTTHVFYRYQSASVYDVEVAPIFLLNEMFETGVNFRYQRGVALIFGIKNINIGKGYIHFMGSFLLSTRKLSNNLDNAFELSASYAF
jgi:hypothetical protein